MCHLKTALLMFYVISCRHLQTGFNQGPFDRSILVCRVRIQDKSVLFARRLKENVVESRKVSACKVDFCFCVTYALISQVFEIKLPPQLVFSVLYIIESSAI